LFLDIVGGDLTAGSSGLHRAGRISYQIAINTATSGWLHEMRSVKAVDHLLLFATEGEKQFDQAACSFVGKMIEQTGIEAALVMCTTIDDSYIRQLHSLSRRSRCHLIVLDAVDLEELIEIRAHEKDIGIILARRRVEGRL
jgi:hypothetical protein